MKIQKINSIFEDIIQKVLEISKEFYGDKLVSFVVYGSCGRRCVNYTSDIDFLIVAENLPKGRVNRVREFEKIEEKVEKYLEEAEKYAIYTRLSPIFNTREEVLLGSPFFLDMVEDVCILYDKENFFGSYLNDFKRREAQEIVELALKGILRQIGIEPPKCHDVGKLVIENKDKLPNEVAKNASKLAKISKDLRKDRELAFYGDIDFIPTEEYSIADARKAIKGAEFAVNQAKNYFDIGNSWMMRISNNSEKPIITPEEFLSSEGINVSEHKLEKALLAFMPIKGMKDKFRCKGVQLNVLTKNKPIFTHTKNYWIRDNGILIGSIYGGPFCSIILEELAAFGLEYAIGYGFSESLDENIGPGDIMIAESSFCSDGTSREYTRDKEAYADTRMLQSLKDVCKSHGISPKVGKAWTTDALYREFPSKIAYWKMKGAKFVNLETSAFYAVAISRRIKAVYLSVVSDNVITEKWSGFVLLDEAIEKMWDINLEIFNRGVLS